MLQSSSLMNYEQLKRLRQLFPDKYKKPWQVKKYRSWPDESKIFGYDESENLTAQQVWEKKHILRKLCRYCNEPIYKANLCRRHYEKQREYNKKYYLKKIASSNYRHCPWCHGILCYTGNNIYCKVECLRCKRFAEGTTKQEAWTKLYEQRIH